MRKGSQVLGLSLIETVMAFFLIITCILLVTNLFHKGMGYTSRTQKVVLGTLVAEKTLARTRIWARQPSGPGYNFDTNWGSLNGVTAPDPEHPEYSVTVDVEPHTLSSPSTAYDAPYSPPQTRKLTMSAQNVRVKVVWDNGDAAHQVVLNSLIAATPHQWRANSPLVITPAGPTTLNRDQSVNFTAVGYDSNDQPIADLFLRWYVDPASGNGQVSQNRDGTQATFVHHIFVPPFTTSYAPPGTSCKVVVRAVYHGVEKTAAYQVSLL